MVKPLEGIKVLDITAGLTGLAVVCGFPIIGGQNMTGEPKRRRLTSFTTTVTTIDGLGIHCRPSAIMGLTPKYQSDRCS